ncbi:MAG: site-2 protease family protein [Hyphomonadaceae bacterium]
MGASRTARSWLAALNHAIPNFIATLLCFWAFIVVLGGAISSHIGDGWLGPFVIVALSFALLWPAVLTHELGHAVFAGLVGWRVWLFCVGPFVLRLRPRPSITLWHELGDDIGGIVWPAPKRAAANTKLRSVLISFGGPLASLVAAVLAYLPIVYSAPGENRLGEAALAAFAATSLACALLGGWPTT